jgi:uncharacterized protein (DUF433 family)
MISDDMFLMRISMNPNVMLGKPVVKGTRLTVEYVLNRLAHGDTLETVLEEYDGLVRDDIYACILFAAKNLEATDVYPLEKLA